MADGNIIYGDQSGGGGGGANEGFNGGAGGDGGSGNDVIDGTSGNDIIVGDGSGGGGGGAGSSNSSVGTAGTGGAGGGGDDIINGGAGNDIIVGDGFNGEDGEVGTSGFFGAGGAGGTAGIGGGNGGAGKKSVSGLDGKDATELANTGGAGGDGASGGNGVDGSGDLVSGADTNGTIYNFINGQLENFGTLAGTSNGFGAGADTLDGGEGSDNLFGLGGGDTFVVDLSDGESGDIDTIWDFNAAEGDTVKILGEDGVTDISINMATGSLAGESGNIAGTQNISADDSAIYFADGSALLLKDHQFSAPEPCFLTGTLVTMNDGGQKAVEQLAIGDSVQASDGSSHAIKWMGQRQVSVQFADVKSQNPICITAGALGDNTPVNDLYVSPDHAMYVDEVLVQANALVNDVSIYQVAEMPEDFFYWHIELASHEIILAEGAATETFVDNEARNRFDNAAEFDALYPNAEPVAEMPIARVKSKRQLSQQTLRKLTALSKATRLSA